MKASKLNQMVPVLQIVEDATRVINRVKKNAARVSPAIADNMKGATLGSIYEGVIIEQLNNQTPYTWRKGNDRSEIDCICIERPSLSFELKTTSGPRIVGSKTQCGFVDTGTKYTSDKYTNYVFVKYKTDGNKINLNGVFVGKLKHSDWKCSDSRASSSAFVPKSVFNAQFKQIDNK